MDSFFPYTPRKAPYETLRDCLVGREALLDELISSLKTQADADTLQHWMILGTRGMGKSHIISMVYHMVKEAEGLNRKWMPVLMNEEEQGVFSLHTLFVRVLTKLGEELAGSDERKSKEIDTFLDSLRDGKGGQEEIFEAIIAYLKDLAAGYRKRLLVLLENADDLFTRCLPNTNDIKKLRNILQNENFLLLFATSPTLFERISRSNAPLYQFFRLRTLDLLDYDQAVDLLSRWARLDERDDLLASLKWDDYRLRVLYHLTGGNPRILLFLYMAIGGQGGIESAVGTFSRLLEKDLSSYYLSRMRGLSNQVQPIVLALAESDRNLTQTEIARKTFLPARSMGTAMARLENDGIVRPVSGKRGKNTPYTLTDHLFRLWHQWRTSLRERKIIEALVEFLAIWYRKKELDTWAREGGLAGLYSREAIDFRKSERFRGYWEPLRVEGKGLVRTHVQKGDYVSLFETLAFFKECGLDADEFARAAFKDIDKRGSLEQAKEQFAARVKQAPEDFDAHIWLGQIMLRKGDYPEAEDVLKRAVELDPKDAGAWKGLGLARLLHENHPGAEKAFVKAVKLDPENAVAWKGLGLARGLQEDYAGAEKAFVKVVKLDPKDAGAWQDLAFAAYKNYKFAVAGDCLLKGIHLDEKGTSAYAFLCEFHLSGNVDIKPLGVLEKALSIENVSDEFRAFIRFLRAMVFLHNGDRTPFSEDLEAGAGLLKGIDKEARRKALGDLLEFLVHVTYQDTIEDIKAYSEGLGGISPDVGAVFNPLKYVLDYYTQYFAPEKKKGASVIRAQRVLDDIPSELRGPVEEMVQTVKKNILWSEKRPK